MYDKIVRYIAKNRMFDGKSGVVAGLSGGADSVCLFLVLRRYCLEHGIALEAVHVHHGIRGEEADRDMNYCKELCKEYNVPVAVYEYDVPGYAAGRGIGSEEAGRILRYQAFEQERLKMGADAVIAVAHHMNDLAETVLFNICRGSGIKGVGGILPVRGNIIRPLLCCERNEIEKFLLDNNIRYCTDSTNSGTDYTRNRIRNEVIPYLQRNINPQTVANIAALAENAASAEEYLAKQTAEYMAGMVMDCDGGCLIRSAGETDEYMLGRIIRNVIGKLLGSLKDIGETHVNGVIDLQRGRSGRRFDISKGLYAVKNTDGIYIGFDDADSFGTGNEPVYVEPPCMGITYNGLTFDFDIAPVDKIQKISNELYTKCFDYDKIKIGLCLRGRMPGDRLVIDDAGHHKSLKQYFIDAGIPARKRSSICLLAEGSDIVWVVGGRISAEYKITKDTVNVLTVRCGGTEHAEN